MYQPWITLCNDCGSENLSDDTKNVFCVSCDKVISPVSIDGNIVPYITTNLQKYTPRYNHPMLIKIRALRRSFSTLISNFKFPSSHQ